MHIGTKQDIHVLVFWNNSGVTVIITITQIWGEIEKCVIVTLITPELFQNTYI